LDDPGTLSKNYDQFPSVNHPKVAPGGKGRLPSGVYACRIAIDGIENGTEKIVVGKQ
jgi:hypothetical protein